MRAVHKVGELVELGNRGILVKQSFEIESSTEGVETLRGNVYLTRDLGVPNRHFTFTYGSQCRIWYDLDLGKTYQRSLYALSTDVAYRVEVEVKKVDGRFAGSRLRFYGLLTANGAVQCQEIEASHPSYVLMSHVFMKMYLPNFIEAKDSYSMCALLKRKSEVGV